LSDNLKLEGPTKGVGRKISRVCVGGGGNGKNTENSNKTQKNCTIKPLSGIGGGNGKKTEKYK